MLMHGVVCIYYVDDSESFFYLKTVRFMLYVDDSKSFFMLYESYVFNCMKLFDNLYFVIYWFVHEKRKNGVFDAFSGIVCRYIHLVWVVFELLFRKG